MGLACKWLGGPLWESPGFWLGRGCYDWSRAGKKNNG
jgi:hypothetical protein